MFEVQCHECPIGHVRTFADDTAALDAGWVELIPTGRASIWLCAAHGGHADRVILREGLAAQAITRNSRVQEG